MNHCGTFVKLKRRIVTAGVASSASPPKNTPISSGRHQQLQTTSTQPWLASKHAPLAKLSYTSLKRLSKPASHELNNKITKLTGRNIIMEFPYEYTTRNARDNIILIAARDLDHLRRIVSPVAHLAGALGLYAGKEGTLKLINSLAYQAIDHAIHANHADFLKENLEEEPIDLPELVAVLSRPISDVLKVLDREQTQTLPAHEGIEE
ncbi:hypothetical protein EI533_25320 [Pseudomonas donghuensis]|nr:hypothetical protein [Pseudomonas donghuensis]